MVLPSTAQGWAKSGGGYAAEEDRAQRHALILRDVAYVIRADMVLRAHATDPLAKYEAMFQRRAERGQAFHQPYLGNREFTAFFSPPDGNEAAANIIMQLGGEYAEREKRLSLGRMLFDLNFQQAKKGRLKYRQHDAQGAQWVDGTATPRFFDAVLTGGGVLDVPAHLYGEVGI